MRERTVFPREVLERLPRLELLVTTGMRNASVDIDYLRGRAVVVSGTQSMGAAAEGGLPSTVEVAWALILAVYKRVAVEDRALRAGAWQLGLPRNLAGATLGVAGLGRLGGAMVNPARVFGMDVIAWSENLKQERADELGVARVSKSELLAESDVLSIHLVLSDRTRGLFGASDLSQMKRSAVLINTSRGPIVDERALVAALRDGTIARCRPRRLRSRAGARRTRAARAGEHRAAAAPGLRQRGHVPGHVRRGGPGHQLVPARRADPCTELSPRSRRRGIESRPQRAKERR